MLIYTYMYKYRGYKNLPPIWNKTFENVKNIYTITNKQFDDASITGTFFSAK